MEFVRRLIELLFSNTGKFRVKVVRRINGYVYFKYTGNGGITWRYIHEFNGDKGSEYHKQYLGDGSKVLEFCKSWESYQSIQDHELRVFAMDMQHKNSEQDWIASQKKSKKDAWNRATGKLEE